MTDAVKLHWHERAREAKAFADRCAYAEDVLPTANPCASYAKLEVPAIDGNSFCARVIRPTAPGPHPVVLMFHDATRGVRGWHHMTRFVALGYAVVALSNRAGVRGVLVEEPLAVGDGLGVAVRVPTCPEPPATGRVIDGDTAADLEATLTDALVLAHLVPRLLGSDAGPLVTWGEGLGGGLALAVAALVDAQAACALNPLPSALDEACATLDVARIVRGLSCPVLMGTCLLDMQAAPVAQDAIACGLADVRRLTYPRYAHERVNAFEDELCSFLMALRNRL